jgi:hypothetical protein
VAQFTNTQERQFPKNLQTNTLHLPLKKEEPTKQPPKAAVNTKRVPEPPLNLLTLRVDPSPGPVAGK